MILDLTLLHRILGMLSSFFTGVVLSQESKSESIIKNCKKHRVGTVWFVCNGINYMAKGMWQHFALGLNKITTILAFLIQGRSKSTC